MPDVFSLLSGRRWEAFARLVDSPGPLTSEELAGAAGMRPAAARTLLRNMAYAGLVLRRTGPAPAYGKGRQADVYTVSPAVRRWWAVRRVTCGGDGASERDSP